MRPESVEKVIAFEQTIDLTDAVTGMLHLQLAALDARFQLDGKRARIAPAVRVLILPLVQGSQFLRRDEVFDHEEAIVFVRLELFGGQLGPAGRS